MEPKSLNKAQLVLLKAMRHLNSEEDIHALQDAITRFFAERADQEMEKLWASGEWNEEKLKSLENAHFRTPYEPRASKHRS
ncbi:MAG: dephospho-CoA kinase [Bacteroidales bacterium]|nr:dephospho-CoA kinase [Bacteroidales bacterium]